MQNNKCFSMNCGKSAVKVLSYSNKKVFCCAEHSDESNGIPPKPSSFLLNADQTAQFKNKLSSSLNSLRKIRSSLITNSGELFESLVASLNSSLKKINDLESILMNILKSVVFSSSLEKSQSDLLQSLRISENSAVFNNFPEVIKKLSNFYENLTGFASDSLSQQKVPNDQCDEIIFARDRGEGGLWSISLESFTMKRLPCSLIVGHQAQICMIDSDTYFISGGFTYDITGDTYIISSKKQYQVYSLPKASPNYVAASVYKDGKVYIFGGSLNAACEVFELSLKKWTRIQNLPIGLTMATAALKNNEIILSGYEASKVFTYNDIQFTEILDVQCNSHKVVCKGWVLTSSGLYEYLETQTWTKHSISWPASMLLVYSAFSRPPFIYFLCSSGVLWRINTTEKTLYPLAYSYLTPS